MRALPSFHRPSPLFSLLASSLLLLKAEAAVADEGRGAAGAKSWKDVPSSVVRSIRNAGGRVLSNDFPINLGGIFASPSSIPGHERGSGVPAFMVTTPWGSPYMIYEQIGDTDVVQEYQYDLVHNRNVKGNLFEHYTAEMEKAEELRETTSRRAVALYFEDEDDARCLVSEMKQMGGGMRDADIRITATNMARALRQSSVLGKGLPSGGVGDMGETEGHLRYKIVPSSRQLYYASKCEGGERVGFFRDDDGNSGGRKNKLAAIKKREQDELLMPRWSLKKRMFDNRAVEWAQSSTKRKKKKDVDGGTESEPYALYEHMRGKSGIPVFYAEGLEQSRGLLGRRRNEVPLFFSYEDLVDAWREMRDNKHCALGEGGDVNIPKVPPRIEVFNYLDIAMSIDREQQNQEIRSKKKNFGGFKTLKAGPLDCITFVPSSKSVAYKDAITALGGGKARLRPMR